MDLSHHPNPNFDLTLLNEIADGSSEFLVETIDLFLQQVPELLGEIEEGIQNQDWDTAGASAHKLKSTLGMFGMNDSLEMMQEIELGAKKREGLDGLSGKISEAKSLISSTYGDIRAIKTQLQNGA